MSSMCDLPLRLVFIGLFPTRLRIQDFAYYDLAWMSARTGIRYFLN